VEPDAERRSAGKWIGTILYVTVMLLGFVWGAHDFNQYRVGTPTTATVTQCTLGGRGGHCEGTWSIGGVSQHGNIKHGQFVRAPTVGSTLDVRVGGGTAYTAGASLPGFGIGVLLGGPIVVAFVWWLWLRLSPH
jgi:hypothetical protein